MDCVDHIANLQLLNETGNIEKLATPPAEWIEARFPPEEAQRHYREKNLIYTVPSEIAGFLECYENMRSRPGVSRLGGHTDPVHGSFGLVPQR